MKIKGKISIFIGKEQTTIEIYDDNASCMILEATLTPDQLSGALSRISHTDCELVVLEGAFNKIGKTHENKTHEFKLPKYLRSYKRDKDQLIAEVKRTCPKGWTPDNYFGSQDSFFKKDGEDWARCTIRRWI